ncbi:hypothetical protein R1sor_022444 [Riccia sorocarpa]|uniref:DUF7869 domain-containing protein n=1 Tax=Riccia sorocarpa TaxID=122646 RepID=A0ABD3GJX2_9MARC
MLTHGREPGIFCHLSLTGLWPGDPNFTVSSLARCLRDLEQVLDNEDHTGDLSMTTSNQSLFTCLLDQTAFKATLGREGAVHSTYFELHGSGSEPTAATDTLPTTFTKLPRAFLLQMDNSAKDNKNIHVLAFCSELVKRGRRSVLMTTELLVQVNFLMVGHTHEDIDALFSKVSARTINKDVLTLPTLMAEIWESEAMHPVPLLLEEVADYKSYVGGFLDKLEGHSQPIGFRFSMANNVPIYKFQAKVDGPWMPEDGHSLWKKRNGQFIFPNEEPRALPLPSTHPRLGEVSPFINNLITFLKDTYCKDETSEEYRKYRPVVSYWERVKANLTRIQPLQEEKLQSGFWPQTNHGTRFMTDAQYEDGLRVEQDEPALDELERELQAENEMQLQLYVGAAFSSPKESVCAT